MKHSKITYALSCLLAFCVPCSMTALSVGAVEPDTAQTAAETEEAFVLPDIISPADAEEYGFVGRDYEAEKDLNTFVFKNADGSATMKVFSHPVKYADEFGKIRDISLDLVKLPDNRMVTVDNKIKTTFPLSLSDGIAVACDGIDLLMVPVTDSTSPTAVFDDKENKVTYHVDNATDYVYGLTYTGFKEDIMVSEYTGQTDYDFTLYTNGLTLTETDDMLMLTDEKGETAAVLSDVIVYTADGGNNTIGSMTYQMVEDNQQYNLTVHLDEAYLSDEATVYPIRIDPSISVNGSSDVHAKCFESSGGSTKLTLNVGRNSLIEKSRVCIGFSQLDLSAIHSSLNVTSAKIELYDELQSTTSAIIKCYQYDGEWDNTGTSWGGLDLGNNKNIYTLLSQKNVSYSHGVNLSTPHRYEFNIKLAVERWVNAQDIPSSLNYDVFDPSKGLIFSMVGEDNTTIKYKRFANCYSGTNSPSMTITYVKSITNNLYFSKFNPEKYFSANSTIAQGASVDLIRYRMNCYGYAFGFIYGDATIYGQNSLQQPGDFSYHNLNGTFTLSTFMDRIQSNLEYDGAALGYTVTEYTSVNPGSTTLPQFGSNSRLIAVAVRNSSFGHTYHCYMQHSDGTWSHKDFTDNVSNVSLPQDSNTNQIILTNDNIYDDIPTGVFANCPVKYFVITKNSAVLPYYTLGASYYFDYSSVGDYAETAEMISVNSSYNQDHYIDYMMDDDIYRIPITSTRYYQFDASIIDPDSDPHYIGIQLYDENFSLIASDTGYLYAVSYIQLTSGKQYYLRVYNPVLHQTTNALNFSVADYGTPKGYYLSIT